MSALRLADIQTMQRRPEFKGFGYLGHPKRTSETDWDLYRAAVILGLTAEDVFLWANSTFGRHLMDTIDRVDGLDFYLCLEADLPKLLTERP